MAPFDTLTQAFINFFGITQPTEKTRKRATIFIMSLMVLTLLIVAIVGGLFYHVLHA
jgi:flagellar basal body-associated protein FliL